MILNTGLGDDSSDFIGDYPSPVIWVWGALALGSYLLLKGWNSHPSYYKPVRTSKFTRTTREMVRKSKQNIPKSKILSKKEENRIFGDLY